MNSRSILLAIASGCLLVLTFPSFNVHYLSWIALVPLFFALNWQTVKSGFALGAITGLVLFGGTVFWVTNSIHHFGGLQLLPASLVTLLLCVYLALYPAIFGAAIVHLKRNHPSLLFLSAPALWTALELARTYIFSGFPWALLGYSQAPALPVIQIADITGVYGISFLIVLVNTAAAEFFMDRKKFAGLIAAALALSITLGYGFPKLHGPEGSETLTVSVIQGNIEQDKKWDPEYRAAVIATYSRLTRAALRQKPDLVIWPETATPFYFGGGGRTDSALTADLKEFVKRNRTPLLFGSPTYDVQPGRVIRLYNSAFLLSAGGTIDAEYNKIHLVPFGEYVPLKGALFFVEKLVQAIGDFRPGKQFTVMPVRSVEGRSTGGAGMSTVICYEIIFPNLVRTFVDRGARIMTTITNDAWFGRTPAPYQHFSMAVFRAVENRVPVARAANTGVSGFIDAAGRVLAKTDIFTEAQLTHTLSFSPGTEKTFYTRHGDLLAYLCMLVSLIMLASNYFIAAKK
ncbi:MAG TPA: apolipoprotein N-acyltransferase [Nitrospiraceae bacterium]|nr:apolipoprotein N-acyltransferase [Nitrospiraceae bacterium]